MKKSIKYLFITVLLFANSCSEEKLDLYPLTSVSEGTYYANLTQIETAADDIYRQIGELHDAWSIPSMYGMLYSDNGAVIAQLAGTPIDQPIDRHQLTSANPRVEEAWDDAYNAIFVANNIIEQIEATEVEIEVDHRNRMIAEARLMRSLAYFNLVRAFGDVPIITEVVSPAEAYDLLREKTDKVYSLIIEDLKFAKNHLQPNYSGADEGRLTVYSAAAVLAKVFLTRGEEAAAKTELEFIINSGEFSLDSNSDGTVNDQDYLHLFQPDTKNSESSILEAQYMAGANRANSNHQEAFSPYLDAFNHPLIDGAINRGNGVNTPTEDLIAEFEEGDPRKEVTVVTSFLNESTGEFIDYPFTLKYFDANWFNPGQNFEIIRYADILLMYSEVTGDPQYLNLVRKRVGLAPYGSTEYPTHLYPTIEEAIFHERRVELAMEMHRFFDLVREGRALEVMEPKVPGDVNVLFPIPLYAIDVNPDLTQNPGY